MIVTTSLSQHFEVSASLPRLQCRRTPVVGLASRVVLALFQGSHQALSFGSAGSSAFAQ